MAENFEEMAAASGALRDAFGDLAGLADGFGRAMATAFRRAIVDGRELEEVLRSLALSLSGRALGAALAPIGQGLGGLIGGLFPPGGLGGAGAAARGGPAAAPATGRAPSAIPAAGAMHVTFNVTTPDAQSFRRAEADVSAMLARAVARGRRGM